MKVIIYKKFGSPEVLQYEDIEVPRPKDDQVLVKLKATSVNPVDYKMRRGIMKPLMKFKLPIVPGSDISGTVEEIGLNVTHLQTGHEVFGFISPVRGGAYAEYAVVNKQYLWHKPENISFEEAAAIPMAGLAAYQALYDKGGIYPGMRVFINGCTGGVGSFAVQIAKAYSCEITGVCSFNNIDFAKGLGVDKVVNYENKDPLKSRNKFDIILDTHGNLKYKEVDHLLYRDGTFINTLPSLSLLYNALIKERVEKIRVNSNRRDLAELKAMVEKNLIKPQIAKTFTLKDAALAHDFCEKGKVQGKVVLKIAD